MLSRVESSLRWDTMNRNKHAKGLAEVINAHCYHRSPNQNSCMSVLSARIKLCNHRQHEGQSVQDHIKELSDIHDAVEAIYGGQGVGTDSEVFEEVERLF